MHFVSGLGHFVLMWSAFVPGRLGVTANGAFSSVRRLIFVGLIVSLARVANCCLSRPVATKGRFWPNAVVLH
jgi:hypothetical protein